MSSRLRYADAVKILGGSGPVVAAVDNLLGAALSVATAGGSDAALSLFDAKAEAVRLGRLATGALGDKLSGRGRYERNRRLQAAHGVLVVTAFFEAFDEVVRAAEFPAPELTRDEQVMVAAGTPADGDWLSSLLESPLPVPAPERTYDQLIGDLQEWYGDAGDWFLGFLTGLAEWDRADERARRVVTTLMVERLPRRATERYEEAHRRLAVDIPEFAVWVDRTETRAVGRGLTRLEEILRRAMTDEVPERHRRALAATYRAELVRPILGEDTGGLTIPRLGEAYVDALFRARECGPAATPAREDWWSAVPARDDLARFLVRYLITPEAATAPLLLLGHPGAGKSALTRILAARLPATDFLAVRVVLREVPAEAPILDQLEHALRAATGERVSWADLSRNAGGAMPVVMLDGFDELLQATGVHRSDYLQRVAEFQRTEAVQERPVAVIVTSRVAVADRARMPEGGLAVRLEPFDDAQVERWLTTWNQANHRGLAARGLRTLPKQIVSRFPDLARQPLLLLMLALYDASDNALQRADASFGTVQLYERLLHDFALREVRRWHEDRPDHELPALVSEELLRLSIVAFAMFNRGRQWVTEAELDEDLGGLRLPAVRHARTRDFRSPLTPGQEVVGRFFFIQRAQATRDERTLQTFEFLHATFGEYLIARLLVAVLTENAEREARRTIRLSDDGDDELLRSLIGYVPLTARNTVLSFAHELLAAGDAAAVRRWLAGRLRAAVTEPQPPPPRVSKRADHWMATYSLNLTLLVLACGEPLRAGELWTQGYDPADKLRDLALMWRGSTGADRWLDVMAAMQVTRVHTDRRADIELRLGPVVSEPIDPLWSHRMWATTAPGQFTSHYRREPALQSMQLSNNLSDDVLRHAIEPVLEQMGGAVHFFRVHGPQDAESVAHSLLRLTMCSLGDDEPALARAYERAVAAVAGYLADVQAGTAPVLLMRLMKQDAGRLGRDVVAGHCRRIAAAGHHTWAAAGAIVECLDAAGVAGAERAEIMALAKTLEF